MALTRMDLDAIADNELRYRGKYTNPTPEAIQREYSRSYPEMTTQEAAHIRRLINEATITLPDLMPPCWTENSQTSDGKTTS